MILEIFGETIDIHGGGEDLRFPHHENECAQSFCRNDGKQLANFWLHNGMVQMADSKMSKSLGNIVLIKDLLNDMPGEVIRLSLMSSHYRQPLKWSDDLVDQASILAAEASQPIGDHRGSEEYKRGVVKTLPGRAIMKAKTRAFGGN